ncbi:hypothetical protein VTO73DRAFT_2380 [Trametes versicolor]
MSYLTPMLHSATSFSFFASRDPVSRSQTAPRVIAALNGEYSNCGRTRTQRPFTPGSIPGSNSPWPSPAPEPSHRRSLVMTPSRRESQRLGFRTPGDGDDGGDFGQGCTMAYAAKRILVWYAEGVPSLPEVDESNSRFAKLRISTSVRKSRVENVMSRRISSGTGDDLAMLPIYAPRYSRVLYQQEEAFRARAGSSIKSTTSCAVEIDVAHRHDSMRGPSTVNSPAASPRKRDNGVGTSSRQTQGPVLVTCLARGNPVGKMHIVPVLEPTSGKKWTITRRRAPLARRSRAPCLGRDRDDALPFVLLS